MKSTAAALLAIALAPLAACASASGDDELMASPASPPMRSTGLDAATDASGMKTEGNGDAAPPRRDPMLPDAGILLDGGSDGGGTVDSAPPPRPVTSCVGIALREGGYITVPSGVPSVLGGVNSPKQFEAWVRPDSTGNVGLFNVGEGSSCGNASCGGEHFTLNISAGFLSLDVGHGVGTTTILVPPSVWSFVFAGWDPTTGYFAGVVDSSGTLSRQRVTIGNNINASVLSPGSRTTLGRDQNAAHLTGIIGGMRAWGRVLSDAEILIRYKVRLSTAERHLAAQWWMEEGTGMTTLDDISGAWAALNAPATWTTYVCP